MDMEKYETLASEWSALMGRLQAVAQRNREQAVRKATGK